MTSDNILASQVRHWKDALVIVKPETLLKWHRQGFRRFWKYNSKIKLCQPRLSAEAMLFLSQTSTTLSLNSITGNSLWQFRCWVVYITTIAELLELNSLLGRLK